ncbi:MAG: glycogen/starch/alpha-glucan phosphorylase [Burkholderiaceae bacterium]|nr:glycogen/starch/alpha-glucan phosphorylase [Burkholderiaceae bacterium]
MELLLDRVERESGVEPPHASLDMWMRAAAHASRAELAERMNQTLREDRQRGAKRVHYLSMEFLMGRALGNALAALGIDHDFDAAARAAGKVPGDVLEREPDAALGNGGLGRLAACFLDSLATLGVPSFGYGLRYRYGIFAQRILDGQQVEEADDWLRNGNPWELPRPELRYPIGFAGSVVPDGAGRRWLPSEQLFADAFDFIVPGHATERVSLLRQWKAKTTRPIDFAAVSRGDFAAAGSAKLAADAINWVLYPDDSHARRPRTAPEPGGLPGQRLAAGPHRATTWPSSAASTLGRSKAIHLERHPSGAGAGRADAPFARRTRPGVGRSAGASPRERCRYTNHTLMPEALETWPVRMLEHWLPRHLEIIYDDQPRLSLPTCGPQLPGRRGAGAPGLAHRRVRANDGCGWPPLVDASPRTGSMASPHCTRELMVETHLRQPRTDRSRSASTTSPTA